jgi:hypothetical protein
MNDWLKEPNGTLSSMRIAMVVCIVCALFFLFYQLFTFTPGTIEWYAPITLIGMAMGVKSVQKFGERD